MRHALLLALACTPCALSQTTWYVDVNGTPPGTGTQSDPYTSLQYAIDATTTVDGDQLSVAAGVYAEPIDLRGKTIAIFASQSDLPTTIDGQGIGVPALRVASREGPGTRIAGLRITGGESWTDFGHQVHVSGSHLELVDCQVDGDGVVYSSYPFPGIYTTGATLTLDACRVVENQSYGYFGGGGLHVADGTVRVLDTLFQGNRGGPGGAVHVAGGSVLMVDSVLAENTTDYDSGGALYVGSGTVALRRCTLRDNYTHSDDYPGGAVDLQGGDFTAQNSSFLRNQSARGGALNAAAGASLTLVGCDFASNVAFSWVYYDGRGGALYLEPGVVNQVERCVFLDNRSEGNGFYSAEGGAWYGPLNANRGTFVDNDASPWGGVGGAGNDGSLVNCILWNNTPDQLTGGAVATYCDVSGGWTGAGNFDLDPQFIGPDLPEPDLHLRSSSPCIDAGDPTSPPDGDGSVADVGAFPFEVGYVPDPVPYCVAKVGSPGCLPAVGWLGSPTLSGPDDFVITADEVVSGQFGLLFWGLLPDEQPFIGGTLCVGGTLVRTPVTHAGGTPGGVDCTGSLGYHFSQAYAASMGLVAFETVYAQWWFRDPGFPPPANMGTSNALAFVLVP